MASAIDTSITSRDRAAVEHVLPGLVFADHVPNGTVPPVSNYTPLPASGHTVRWAEWGHGDPDDDLADAQQRVAEVTDFRWENEGWTISGQVAREQVQYVVRLSASWQVRQFLLFRDLDDPDLWLATDGTARWGEMNGAHRIELDGCYDIDLACTPFTNSLPIRRLPLHVGDSAELPVVTVDVETLDVRAVTQRYIRLDTHRWRVSDRADHSVEFDVDQYGLVVDYPGMFRRIM